jgi:hypothetical protein
MNQLKSLLPKLFEKVWIASSQAPRNDVESKKSVIARNVSFEAIHFNKVDYEKTSSLSYDK